ncbi:hypothetical protein QYE76_000590 [Lolium multiflorum]|uniref:Uncharacterized protein n=1 Tax=Lolium multiflorum TaxID=4521 RepID=A0AAD8RK87_LOLMU|nr:hypothetical protein QYE76_000590 [Lolium multiflorum]
MATSNATICENIKGLNKWAPASDSSIRDLLKKLNTMTVKDRHPMPVVDELLDELAGETYFTKLDLYSG